MYRLKGKEDGCNSPTIYTTELDQIMGQISNVIRKNKDTVLDNLLDIYKNITEEKDFQKDIMKKETQILTIQNKKDKLLELAMDDLVSKKEFADRNNKFNEEIITLKNEIEGLHQEQNSAKKVLHYYENLRQDLTEAWNQNIDSSNILLDKIIVHKTTDKNKVRLEIFLRTGDNFKAELFSGKTHSITLCEIGISHNKMQRKFKRPFSGVGDRGTYEFCYDISVSLAC
jgi:site-specific DNA recombinase